METNVYIDNMINWAVRKLGSTEYNGWCLSFVEDALEKSNNIEIFGGDSAKESLEIYKDELNLDEPEKGSFVFYDCMCFDEEKNLVNYGHVGICIGESKVIHAFDRVRIDNYLDIEKLTSLTGDHPKYLGWVKIDRVLKQKGE